MITDNELKQCLDIWFADYSERKTELASMPPHMTEERLYELAGEGRFAAARPEETAHLSRCPQCMAQWAFWCEVEHAEIPADEEKASPVISGGILRAAAGPGVREAQKSPSDCGRFQLGIFPELNNPDAALIALEVIAGEANPHDGIFASVRDANGNQVISGVIKNNRLARRHERLSQLALSAWSLVLAEQAST